MPLHLGEKTGELERDAATIVESYRVYPRHPAYSFVWHTCLSINAMSAAICALDSEPLPEGYLSLACKAHNTTVRLPANGVVRYVKTQPAGDAPWVQVTFAPGEPGKNDGWAHGFRHWMWLTVGAGFVQLYAEHMRAVHRRGTEAAMTVKVVRDACAHGMKITCRKNCGAMFGQVKISEHDNGRPLADFMGLGDFFVLALRAFSEPTPSSKQLPPPTTLLR